MTHTLQSAQQGKPQGRLDQRALASLIKAARPLTLALLTLGIPALHATSSATITSPSTPVTVAVGQAVTFAGTSTNDLATEADSASVVYTWAFGDGTSGSGASTTHAYGAAGTYTVTFTARWTIRVCARPTPEGGCLSWRTTYPIYTATQTVTVLAPPSIGSFTASAASVLQGSAVTLTWSTANATSLSLSGVGAVTGTSATAYPSAVTTYTLTASNAVGSVSASVTVSTQPVTVSIAPGSASIPLGGTVAFTGSATAANPSVTWSSTGGSLSGSTFTGTASGTFTVKATSVADPTKSASATVTVGAVGVSALTPANPTVLFGGSQTFTSSVSGAVNTGLTWSVSGGGSINASGAFTATTPGVYTVTATSVADPTKAASTPVTVSTMGVTTPTPANATIPLGATQTFSASVTGAVNTAVTWSASPGATITSAGVFSAPASGAYTVTATSVADPSKSASTQVTVATVAVSVPTGTPASRQTFVGGSVSFTASVTGAVNPGLTWSVNGGGSITSAGVFTASAQGTWTVTAQSAADPSKAAATTVQVLPLSIALTPNTLTVRSGQTQAFTASVTGPGTPSQAVTWSVVEVGGGSITPSGTYTAPGIAGDYTVKATSVQDPSSSATARVHVPGWVLKHKKDIVYVGTKEIAEVQSDGTTAITLTDHLGSPRYQWAGGSSAVIEQKFLPFGESLADPASSAAFAKGFTNHEQTDPSGLIYMQARYYIPWYGRFGSSDPARDQHFEATQSWNIYSYVQNDPIMRIDPTGMFNDPVSEFFQGLIYRVIDNGTLGHVDRVASTMPGAPQPPPGVAGRVGMLVGDALGFAGGATATGAGYGGAVITSPTGVGAVAGVAVGAYGFGVAATSVKNTVADVVSLMTAAVSSGGGGQQKQADESDRKSPEPAFKTDKEARAQAEKLGYEPTRGERGKAQVFERKGKGDGPRFITRDRDGHNGGAFKGAERVSDLSKKVTRSGTFDQNLKRIGD